MNAFLQRRRYGVGSLTGRGAVAPVPVFASSEWGGAHECRALWARCFRLMPLTMHTLIQCLLPVLHASMRCDGQFKY